ncbi:MAG: hypothetical protein ACLUGI_10925 [Subdoligranulum sp.]
MDGMMNNVNYGDAFDAMAAAVQDTLHAKAALAKLPRDLLTDCECLPCVDDLLTGVDDRAPASRGRDRRAERREHPGAVPAPRQDPLCRKLAVQYAMLESAWHIVSACPLPRPGRL